MKTTTAACVLVALFALVQLPAFNARHLRNGTFSQRDMRVGTTAVTVPETAAPQDQNRGRVNADVAVQQTSIKRQLLQAPATATAVRNAYNAATECLAAADQASSVAAASASASSAGGTQANLLKYIFFASGERAVGPHNMQ